MGQNYTPPADNAAAKRHPKDGDNTKFYEYHVTYARGQCAGVAGNSWKAGSDIPRGLGHIAGLKPRFPFGATKNPFVDCKVIRVELLKNRGRIHLKNVGAGAGIFVDGDLQEGVKILKRGDDRIVTDVQAGDRQVRIEKTGFLPWEQTISVTGQRRIELTVVLVEAE